MTRAVDIEDRGVRVSGRSVGVDSAINDSRVSRYEFEQDVLDSWGDNDGTKTSAVTFTTDSAVGDYAVDIPSTSGDFVTVSGFGNSITSPPITVTAQLKNVNTSDFIGYFKLGGSSIEDGLNIGFGGGTLQVYLNQNFLELTSTTVSSSSYDLFVVTYDGSTIEWSINGAAKSSKSISISLDFSGDDALLGSYVDSDNPLNGLLDDVRVYDKILTDNEISNLN